MVNNGVEICDSYTALRPGGLGVPLPPAHGAISPGAAWASHVEGKEG